MSVKLSIDHLSYSSLMTLTCPYAFFLKHDAGLRGPSSSALALGNAVHLGLQLGHTDDGFDLKQAIKIFEKEFNRLILEEDIVIGYPQLRKALSEGTDMLVIYGEQIQAGVLSKKPLALEQEFSFEIAGIPFVGRIDKVEEELDPETGEKEYVITDFKSGREKPDPWFLSRDLQFTSYYVACKELYGKYPKKAYYHHLRSGERLETTRSEEDFKRLVTMVENAVKIRDQGIRHRIYNSPVCKWCDYRGAICDDPALEDTVLAQLESEKVGKSSGTYEASEA